MHSCCLSLPAGNSKAFQQHSDFAKKNSSIAKMEPGVNFSFRSLLIFYNVMYLTFITRLMSETIRNYFKPCGVGSYLVVLLLLAVAVVEGYRKQKMRTSGSNVELENEVPCSLQEKSKGSNFLDDSALESK